LETAGGFTHLAPKSRIVGFAESELMPWIVRPKYGLGGLRDLSVLEAGDAYALHIQLSEAMFQWDRGNLRKIKAHNIEHAEAEQALLNGPILVYSQDVGSEPRFVYYGETNAGRLLAVIITERGDNIRVVTSYDLDAGQRRDYIKRRAQGE